MKITIIGKGTGWKLAPQEGETWGVNDLCFRRPVKLIFNMHRRNYHIHPELVAKIDKYAKDKNIPIIDSVNFPLDKMHIQYFESSIAYMVAYAIYKDATEIDLYGVHLLIGEEYTVQRANTEYWIGYARGKGIKVKVNEPTTICKHIRGMYGYTT